MKNIYLGFSSKDDGSMKNESKNINSFIKRNNLDNKFLVLARLNHGNEVLVLDDYDYRKIPEADALLTNRKDLLLAITVADCLPLYFFDSSKKVIGIVHAGWRGLVSGIIINTIKKMKDNYNSKIEDIIIFIGPHIRSCCFEIKADIKDKFKKNSLVFKDGKIFVNLSDVAERQLLEQGVLKDNISFSSECTSCLSDKYFSFRRDKGSPLKTMLAYIALK